MSLPSPIGRRLGAFLLLIAAAAVQPQAQPSNPKSPAEIVKDNDSSLALILSADGDSVSLGSGFFIGDGSAVVTNFHVVQGAKRVVITTGAGEVLHADSVYAFDEKKGLSHFESVSDTTPHSEAR